MSSSDVSNIIAASALIVNVVVLAFLGLQIRHAKESFVSETGRARMHATIEFLAASTEKRNQMYRSLPHESDASAVASFLSTLDSDEDAVSRLNEYLGHFELLASGVNAGGFDIDVVYRFLGFTIIRVFHTYRQFIEDARVSRAHPELFIEVEALASRMSRIRASQRA